MVATHRVRCPHCGTRQPFDLSGTDACAPAKCVNSKCRRPFWAYVRDGVFVTAKEPIREGTAETRGSSC